MRKSLLLLLLAASANAATVNMTNHEINVAYPVNPQNPITLQFAEDEGYQTITEKGQANGYASLDADAEVPTNELPQEALVSTNALATAYRAHAGDGTIHFTTNDLARQSLDITQFALGGTNGQLFRATGGGDGEWYTENRDSQFYIQWQDIDDKGIEEGNYAQGIKIADGQDTRVTSLVYFPSEMDTNELVTLDISAWVNEGDLGAGNTGIVWQLYVRYMDSGDIMTNQTPDGIFTITNYFDSVTRNTLKQFQFSGSGGFWSTDYASLELWCRGTSASSTFNRRVALYPYGIIEYKREEEE